MPAPRKSLQKPEQPSGLSKARRRIVVEGAIAPSSSSDTSYFASGNEKENIQFFSSGCSTVDEALGGGFAMRRVSNIVGDKSTGKTLLAMEAAANFALQYPDGVIRYAEAEDAFDSPYADALGIPMHRIELNKPGEKLNTVEDWYNDLNRWMDTQKGRPGLYIEDSLDALSDSAEMDRGFDEGSFGGNKPKQIGKLFRMINSRMAEQNVHLMIISQMRDKIGVTFGETKTRSGGKALDFYSAQIMWLADLGKIKRTVNGIERIVGIDVRAKIKKNKVGLAFREADYPVLFGYGIDDLTSMVEWLLATKREAILDKLGFSKSGYKTRLTSIRNKGGQPVQELRAQLRKHVREEWAKIETDFLPQSRKY